MSGRKKPAPDAAVHTPFSWLVPELEHDEDAQFTALTMDLCLGIGTCLELVYSSDLERHGNQGSDPGHKLPPLLPKPDSDRLLRLAMTASRLLAEFAEKQIDRRNEHEMDKRTRVADE